MGFFGGGGAAVDLASPTAIGSTTPNTGAFTTLSFAPANNTTGFSNTGNSLTESNAQSLVSLAQTWNTTGTPTAIKLNVTDTASNASSLLMDLQVGGSSKLRSSKGGVITINNGDLVVGSSSSGGINIIASSVLSLRGSSDYGNVCIGPNGAAQFAVNLYSYPQVRQTGYYGWSNSNGNAANPLSAALYSDAANIIEQRMTTNAQTFRLYNTYTSATNFERLNFRWASNEFILDAEKGSAGGTLRGIKIGSATTSLLGFYGVTPVDQPATITDPTGGGTQDAEARTAINAIIDRLQELGLIA